jgi:hypothetical protein
MPVSNQLHSATVKIFTNHRVHQPMKEFLKMDDMDDIETMVMLYWRQGGSVSAIAELLNMAEWEVEDWIALGKEKMTYE